ncbi:hypothetical protein [Spirosoma utsteinense]|uniref:Transporter n=1 Tax=Spirosoma utsteinense TaxID=2585773 RepID=A0ABR6W591_9BACT|nr:hypothetical protein [Spirosoma utsteinense]MBC3787142.1 hypothetical protein [Spirosoma utsteinense]MBC3791308.1 hypothetical protein [Spirosoma utsteinense]
MRLTLPIAVFLLSFFVNSPTHAQGLVDGFMRGQRKASLAVSYSQESYDSYYTGKTEIRNPNLGTVFTQSLNLYGTYGLGYDLDLIVSAPYVRTEASAGYWQKQEGFQDLSAALRWEAFDYKIGSARLSWLFAVGYSLPLQNYVIDAPVAIGHGSRNLDGRTLLHFKSGAFFLTGQLGYIRRGQVTLDRVVNYYDPDNLNPNSSSTVNVPDVIDAVIRGGVATKHFYIDGWVQQQRPYNKGTDIAPGIPFPTNAIGFTRTGISVYLPLIKKFGLNGGYSTTLNGQNSGKATRLSGGIVIGI